MIANVPKVTTFGRFYTGKTLIRNFMKTCLLFKDLNEEHTDKELSDLTSPKGFLEAQATEFFVLS
jgi:hypothetical protein